MKKIAILSDIHANRQALKAVLDDCKIEGVNAFWLLGDYVDYGASPIPVMHTLQTLTVEHALAGNHEACLFNSDVKSSQTPHGLISYENTLRIFQQEPSQFEWVKTLQPMKLVNDTILLVHGTPEQPYWGKFLPSNNQEEIQSMFAYMEKERLEYMFLGHSHISFMMTKNGRSIINPGSVGQPRNGYPLAQYVVFDNGNIKFKKIPYDIDAAAEEIRVAKLPEYLWTRLFIGR